MTQPPQKKCDKKSEIFALFAIGGAKPVGRGSETLDLLNTEF